MMKKNRGLVDRGLVNYNHTLSVQTFEHVSEIEHKLKSKETEIGYIEKVTAEDQPNGNFVYFTCLTKSISYSVISDLSIEG